MANKNKKKLTKYERKRKINLIVVGILAGGLILTTILSIIMTAVS